jgi:lipoprotein signal peptidase
MFDKKEMKKKISSIDRKRIFIFVAITYGITIVATVVTYLEGRQSTSMSLVAGIMQVATVFAGAIGNCATRLITREGWSNTYLRPNLRRG